MFEWVEANLGTIFVALILLIIVSMIIRKMISDRRQGKSSCGCDCGHCAMSGSCHQAGSGSRQEV